MNKKELRALKAGMTVTLKWDDVEHVTKALLLETPDIDRKGDVSLMCFHYDTCSYDRHAIHSQVVGYKYSKV